MPVLTAQQLWCCIAMEHAVAEYYIEIPFTYNNQKQRINLSPILHRYERDGDKVYPVMVVNFCPFCGKDLWHDDSH